MSMQNDLFHMLCSDLELFHNLMRLLHFHVGFEQIGEAFHILGHRFGRLFTAQVKPVNNNRNGV